MNLSKRSFSTLAATATLLLATACSSPVKLDQPPVESRSAMPNDGSGAAGSGTSQSQVANVDLGRSGTEGLAKVVYFDFDSFVVRDEYRPVVDAYSKVLNADRKKRVVIEGHTDERGGREYNLALGQKRAEAVAKSLTLLGVQDSQIESVSFGKERPAVQGGDETAWAKNRRAELRDR
ncbi:MAG TPA: peptidoglycan-associated lipoprotein Pal [Methylibium sp.]|uniref:peptidoglycan-associated lipoprotein Pal n=1 Tax=Methylibium sp. TaxID=2067992 RepID=UPI002DB77FA5|nr:peptidoglycan-associated lipoprotein Pal [Methylibium sp.]HEU4458446.1 peptidoglycan-associated lipoprotein Pal [Methylibium sp.]